MNILESATEFFITLTLPAVLPESIELEVNDDDLEIRCHRPPAVPLAEEQCRRQERWQGTWRRRLSLPKRVQADGVAAELANGVLVIRVPKAPVAPPRRVVVTTREP